MESGSHVKGEVVVRIVGCVARLAIEIGHVRHVAQGRQGQISFAGRRCSCHSRNHGCGVRKTPDLGVRTAVLSRNVRAKSRCSRGGRLFHCSRVLILVASKSRATGKGLLAICKGAFVRTFSRVDATMSGQRA